MATKETGGPEDPMAQRLRLLREALNESNATAFAERLGISASRWNNFERGTPLSREVAIKLVRAYPGLSLDWLYLGETRGLTLEMARTLDEALARKGATGAASTGTPANRKRVTKSRA
ncbi:MAG TPA: helix-turn-helix transcriptional regulator [Xanthobacteraceae bacterium]|nr:helix-turn-helix transcriptional regulator [Xanthobacteraceae bacterium]